MYNEGMVLWALVVIFSALAGGFITIAWSVYWGEKAKRRDDERSGIK